MLSHTSQNKRGNNNYMVDCWSISTAPKKASAYGPHCEVTGRTPSLVSPKAVNPPFVYPLLQTLSLLLLSSESWACDVYISLLLQGLGEPVAGECLLLCFKTVIVGPLKLIAISLSTDLSQIVPEKPFLEIENPSSRRTFLSVMGEHIFLTLLYSVAPQSNDFISETPHISLSLLYAIYI